MNRVVIKSASDIPTISNAPKIVSGCSTLLTRSYPEDMEQAFEWENSTLTSNGESQKAFKEAGLR